MADTNANQPAQPKGRMKPHNPEAEQSILGCILIDEEAAVRILGELDEKDFYSEVNRTIYSAMRQLATESKPIDYVTLSDKLDALGKIDEVGGMNYIVDLSQIVPSAANYQQYLDIVTRDSTLRRLIDASQDIITKSFGDVSADDAVKFAEKSIFDISASKTRGDLVAFDSAVAAALDRMEKMAIDKDAFKGVKTGFFDLDDMTNGLQKSDLIILAARPSVGKTTFAMNIITNAALSGKRAAVFSLEMPAVQIAQRVLCYVAGVEMTRAKKGELNADDFARFFDASRKLSGDKIFIDDTSMTNPSEILGKCRRLKREKGLDIVMIDYLQLMSTGKKNNGDNRNQDVGEITRSLKIMARELDVPIILLSQLSRAIESRTDKTPMLSDLRESGSIEQDADIVMFLSRAASEADDEESKNIVILNVAKHRNGEIGDIFLKFDGQFSKFTNIKVDKKYGYTPSKKKKQKESDGGAENGGNNAEPTPQESTPQEPAPQNEDLPKVEGERMSESQPQNSIAPPMIDVGSALEAAAKNVISIKPVFDSDEGTNGGDLIF